MKWEYLVEKFEVFDSMQEFQDILDKIGGNGWEVASANYFSEVKKTLIIFKRPKDENKE